MSETFDVSELLMVLDATEATGAPPHLVERLRELVMASAWGWDDSACFAPSRVIQAGESFKVGDRVIFEQDGLIYQASGHREAGTAIRDIREGEFVRFGRPRYFNGFSYDLNPYEFG